MLDAAGICSNIILPPPDADFSFSCLGNGWIQFSDSSLLNPTSWYWNFGDGLPASNLQNPAHLFSVFPAIYQVSLHASNMWGSDYITLSVAIDASGNCISLDTANVIIGKRYHDFNINCIMDSLEYGLPNRIIEVLPGPQYSVTNANGDYFVFVGAGNFTVTEVPYTGWGQHCPTFPNGYIYNITGYGNYLQMNNFGDTISMSCPDLRLDMSSWHAIPCAVTSTTIYCTNFGTQTANGVVANVTFDPLLTLQSSIPTWSSQAGNTLTWNIGTLLPGQSVIISVQSLLSCFAIIGNNLVFNSDITPVAGDCTPANNSTTDYCTISNSWDPNNKCVKARNFALNGYVNNDTISASDELNYVINFQNTGTSSAVNIFLLDTIDSGLDVSSVQLLSSSHTYTSFSIIGSNILKWHFININLPDSGSNQAASHGFVKFKIKQLPGNTTGTHILNRAGIYFDSNPAVITNYVTHTINTNLSIPEIRQDDMSISINPNPFSFYTSIHLSKPLQSASLRIYDMLGKEIKQMENLSGKEIIIRRDNMKAGMYFFRIEDKRGFIGKGKMVVE
jgi:uncharacterized repeat protein (TIGR01451 family)